MCKACLSPAFYCLHHASGKAACSAAVTVCIQMKLLILRKQPVPAACSTAKRTCIIRDKYFQFVFQHAFFLLQIVQQKLYIFQHISFSFVSTYARCQPDMAYPAFLDLSKILCTGKNPARFHSHQLKIQQSIRGFWKRKNKFPACLRRHFLFC